MKIRPVVAELFHAEGRTYRHTDMAKLIVAFSNLATAPKNKEIEENGAYCRVFSFSVVQNRNKQTVVRGTLLFSFASLAGPPA